VVPESDPVDSRADRATQGAVAVILLSAFVFSQSWVIPVLGVLVGAGAAFGPAGNPFLRLYAALVAPRLSKPATFEDPVTVRVQDMLTAALLVVATLALLISLNAVSWVIAVAASGAAATAAQRGVHLGLAVRDLIRRRA